MKKLKDFLKTHKSLLLEFGLRYVFEIAMGIIMLLIFMRFFEVEIIPFMISYCLITLVVTLLFMYLERRRR